MCFSNGLIVLTLVTGILFTFIPLSPCLPVFLSFSSSPCSSSLSISFDICMLACLIALLQNYGDSVLCDVFHY